MKVSGSEGRKFMLLSLNCHLMFMQPETVSESDRRVLCSAQTLHKDKWLLWIGAVCRSCDVPFVSPQSARGFVTVSLILVHKKCRGKKLRAEIAVSLNPPPPANAHLS